MTFRSFKTKWKRWSLSSKFTAIGTFATIIGIILTIIFYLLPYNYDEIKADSNVEVKMRVHYGGFFRINVVNTSKTIAEGCRFRIETWALGAPAEDILIEKGIPDLVPGSDWIYDVDIFKARSEHSGETNLPRSPIAGYIVIMSKSFKNPKALSFYIPKENEWKEYNWDDIFLIEFDFTRNEPRYTVDNLWRNQLKTRDN